MRKIMIIGAGGIGSFLIPLLNKTGLYKITVFDPDIVEKKNIPYQNFEMEDVDAKKVEVMRRNYSSVNVAQPFPVLTKNQIQGFDLVVFPVKVMIGLERKKDCTLLMLLLLEWQPNGCKDGL